MRTSALFLIAACGLISAIHADPVANVRALYAAVNAADLRTESIDWQTEDGPGAGEVKRFLDDDDRLRKVATEVTLGDHGWRVAEIYLDEEHRVRFIYAQQGSWQFDGGSGENPETKDSFDELRFYFDEAGELVSTLGKSYQIRGKDEDRAKQRAAADAAENRKIDVGDMAASRIREAAGGFIKAGTPEGAAGAEERLFQAIDLRDESEPSTKPADWVALEWPEDTRFDETFSATGVAYELLDLAGIPTHGPEAPAVVTHAVLDPDANPPSSVLVTLDRLADDSVRGMRYRIDLEFGDDRVWRPVFFGRQVRCWEGRGHGDWSKEPCR